MHWKGCHKKARLLKDDNNSASRIINELPALSPTRLLLQDEVGKPPYAYEYTTVGRLTTGVPRVLPVRHLTGGVAAEGVDMDLEEEEEDPFFKFAL